VPRPDPLVAHPGGVAADALVAQPRAVGDDGVWFFISADIALFAVLFAAFMFHRHEDPLLFEQSRHLLDAGVGTLNTLILLTSSWLVALAVHAAREGDRAAVSRYLTAGIGVGAGFALTGLHFVHFLIGMAVLTVCWHKCRRDPIDSHYRVWIESSGCYWHMVDLLRIVLFPMIYRLRA
jgi:nitric oxide reductase NorE protein